MHLLLTDILACPVCGPEHGLVLLADTMRDRRVSEGQLGCANCRRKFPIRTCIALLDPETDNVVGDTAAATSPSDPETALRMAALLGLNDVSGFALVAGPAAGLAADIAGLAGSVEVVADAAHYVPVAAKGGSADDAVQPAVSRVAFGARLPFRDGRLRAIWLSGPAADRLLEEAARTLHPIGRLVLEPAPPDFAARLAAAGLKIAVAEKVTALAIRA